LKKNQIKHSIYEIKTERIGEELFPQSSVEGLKSIKKKLRKQKLIIKRK
jgi:hypothetical protein